MRYPPGPLHARDPRLKLASLLGLSLATLVASGSTLVIPLLLLLAAFRYAEQPLGRTLLALKPLILIALLIAVSRTITAAAEISVSAVTSGAAAAVEAAPAAAAATAADRLGALRPPPQAIVSGIEYAVRLLMVALFGQLFLATTSRGRIIDTLRWVCSPRPPTARTHVPLAVAVALSSYPLMARGMQQTRDACVARGVNPRKSPALLMKRIVRAAVDEAPLRITRVADAVSVRGFSAHSTPPRFQPAVADVCLALLVLLTMALTIGLTVRLAPL